MGVTNYQVAAVLRFLATSKPSDYGQNTLGRLWTQFREDHQHFCPVESECTVCARNWGLIHDGKLMICRVLGFQPSKRAWRLSDGVKRPSVPEVQEGVDDDSGVETR